MSIIYTKQEVNPNGTTGPLLAAQRWTDLLAGPTLRLLGATEPVPAGHVELDVATLPDDLRERGVAQATTDNLTLLRVLARYRGVRSVAGSAERTRRIELNILWHALDRDGVYGAFDCDYPSGTQCPWSLDHPDLWDEEGWENVSDDEIRHACVRLHDDWQVRRGKGWRLRPTAEGRERLAREGGQALLDAHDAVPRDEKRRVLPMNAEEQGLTTAEWRDAQSLLNRAWNAYWDGKRSAVRQMRRELAWEQV